MNLDHKQSAHWAMQVKQVLGTEFGAPSDVDFTIPPTQQQAFAPVISWLTLGVAPVTATIARLRGEPARFADELMKAGKSNLPHVPAEPLVALIKAQTRYSFPYDAFFEQTYQSAADFAAGNSDMIVAHFGSAEKYAEYYAETSSETMMDLSARSLGDVLAARVGDAFARRDVDTWSACFPGAFTRGMIRSYVNALGPLSATELATDLQRKLHAAFHTNACA